MNEILSGCMVRANIQRESKITRCPSCQTTHAVGQLCPQSLEMILHCPVCFQQHIDAPDAHWTNPPHKSHKCAGCGAIWRPADIFTTGVRHIRTHGHHDTVIYDVK